MKQYKTTIIIFLTLSLWALGSTDNVLLAQAAPAEDENIPYLVTFGGDGDPSWGDDDFCQIFFAKIPESVKKPIYIRVYDPDTGGELDEKKGEFNTSVEFSIYGGPECWTHEDAKNIDPVGNYKSGTLLDSKIFRDEEEYDEDWHVFGPFNPREGEYVEQFEGYVFKIIAEGVSGNDGNLYRYYLSSEQNESKEIEGGNMFTYEYTFRMWNNQNNVSQIYPYIDDKTTAIEIKNFDWDNDGFIRLVSVAKNGLLCTVTGEDEWAEDRFPVHERERNSSMELQFIKNRNELVKNNNVVVVVQNQYGENLPFYVVPIGGIPSYQPKIRMEVVDE